MALRSSKRLQQVWGDLSLTTKGFAVILLSIIPMLAGFALLYRALLAENEAAIARTVILATAQAMVGFGVVGGLIAMALFSRSIVRRVQLIQQNARCLRMGQALVPLRLGEDEIGQVEKELEVTSEFLAGRAKKLRESEERLQAIIDQTTAVIYMKDLEGRYLLINRHYEELFGVTREEARGRTDAEVFPKQIAAKFRENDLRVMSAGRPMEFEEIAPHRDGLHTYISLKFPLLDASNRPYAVCGISTDISERKRFEDALRHANEELARQSENLNPLAPPPVDFSAPPVGWIAESRREVREEALTK